MNKLPHPFATQGLAAVNILMHHATCTPKAMQHSWQARMQMSASLFCNTVQHSWQARMQMSASLCGNTVQHSWQARMQMSASLFDSKAHRLGTPCQRQL